MAKEPPSNLVSITGGQANKEIREELCRQLALMEQVARKHGVKGFAMVMVLPDDDIVVADLSDKSRLQLIVGLELLKFQLMTQPVEG